MGVLGGETREVQVSLNPQKLEAYGLTIADVSNAISASNNLMVVGRLEDNDLLYLVVNSNAFKSIDSVREVELRNNAGGIIHLSDVAKIDDGGRSAVASRRCQRTARGHIRHISAGRCQFAGLGKSRLRVS